MLGIPLPPYLRVSLAQSHSPTTKPFVWPDDIVHVGPHRLRNLVKPGMRVTIAFTDATRACPDELLVGWLVEQLMALGVAPAKITLLCATGLHRPINQAELLVKLGSQLAENIRIANHYALDPGALIDLGELETLLLITDRLCVETDLLLATGVVEPHQYAGYSGGAKTVVIGCGGEATIQATHSAAMFLAV